MSLAQTDRPMATPTNPAPESEHELLDRVRRGDRSAMGALLQLHQTRLYNTCLRMVSNRDDAAELTQEVMLKIVQHIDEYRGGAELSTWMIRIAMNQSISHLRKRKVRRAVSLDGDARNGAFPAPDDQATALRARLADSRELSPDSRVEREETLERLRQAIAQLDDEYRAVLVLRDIDELDYGQIAEALGLPLGTVKSRLFRARLALRELMAKMERGGQASEPAPRRVAEG